VKEGHPEIQAVFATPLSGRDLDRKDLYKPSSGQGRGGRDKGRFNGDFDGGKVEIQGRRRRNQGKRTGGRKIPKAKTQ